MKAILSIAKLDNKDIPESLVLYSTQPSDKAEFSIYDLDGEGGGCPFNYGNTTFELLDFHEESEMSDKDSFFDVQQSLLQKAIEKGIELPEYGEIW